MECDARFHGDGWTILTTSVQKGWNSTIGFLKKGFIRLRELVDIAAMFLCRLVACSSMRLQA